MISKKNISHDEYFVSLSKVFLFKNTFLQYLYIYQSLEQQFCMLFWYRIFFYKINSKFLSLQLSNFLIFFEFLQKVKNLKWQTQTT